VTGFDVTFSKVTVVRFGISFSKAIDKGNEDKCCIYKKQHLGQ
jgi:hypothetical protein